MYRIWAVFRPRRHGAERVKRFAPRRGDLRDQAFSMDTLYHIL